MYLIKKYYIGGGEIFGDDFTIGLSIVFLKFSSPTENSFISIAMKKEVHEDNHKHEEHIFPGIDYPTESFQDGTIFTSFEESPAESVRSLELNVSLYAWDQRNELYFTVTSYKIAKRESHVKDCEHYR